MSSSDGIPEGSEICAAMKHLQLALGRIAGCCQPAAAMLVEGAIRILADDAPPPLWVRPKGRAEPDAATGRDVNVALIVNDLRNRFGGSAAQAAVLQSMAFVRVGHEAQAQRLVAAAVLLSRA